MVRSVIVLLVLVVAFVGFQALFRRVPDPTPPVDYRAAVAAARQDAPFRVLAPARLPEGWRATSVGYTPSPQAHWHLGLLTSDDEYVGLEQVVGVAGGAVADFAPGSLISGTTTIAGRQWQLRSLPGQNRTTLVLSHDGETTLVTGTATPDVLASFAASLRGG